MMTLYDLNEGEEGIILKIKGRGHFRQRLSEMGFVVGKKVLVIRKAPLRDPVEYRILDYHVSLRNSEAQLIEIVKDGMQKAHSSHNGTLEDVLDRELIQKSRTIQVGLIGNPNSGKTTLFNHASRSREKVGNYAGVTVDSKEAEFQQSGYTFSLVDLPGTYSLKSYSPEEVYVRNYILDSKPDIILNIVDASNIERNLYLTTQLIDMGVQMVIALNMYDELEKRDDRLDHVALGKLLGVPVIPTVSSRGRGIRELFDQIIKVYENREPLVRHIHINYGSEIENSICAISSRIKIPGNASVTNVVAARYIAIELLSNDKDIPHLVNRCINPDAITEAGSKERSRLSRLYSDPIDTVITDVRYGFISGALEETLVLRKEERQKRARKPDRYLIDRYLGIPIFVFFMWLTFFVTFEIGGYPQRWLESAVALLSGFVSENLPSGALRDLLTDGIIGGVGGVIVFLPNIIILFLFISFMEDTGYMARAVFLMDRIMHKIGLHGKSFIPLFMGFGCNVPAIMATRIIESRRDRMITMLITPFMSCSARLPVYILFISAFFAKNQGLMLLILYGFGMLLAVLSALLLRKVYFKTPEIPFVMELPPYRMPTARSIVKHVWFRTEVYLKKIGSVILLASVVIWVLSNYPRKSAAINELISSKASVEASDLPAEEKAIQLETIDSGIRTEQQRSSYIGRLGKLIEPVMRPLGFDWRLSVSILSGLAAKEVVVSTMGVLFNTLPHDEPASLVHKIQSQTDDDGNPLFTPLIAFSFMIFILTYSPCIGVVSAISRESGSWKWAAFIVIYTVGVAWLLSFTIFQAGSLIL